jgi:hypothetical protein
MRRGIKGIPIIINNRNLSIWPKAMVAELRRMKLCGPIVIVDNASTNPDTLKWYDELSKDDNAVVIYARFNGGHRAPFTLGVPQSLFEQFGHQHYVVTDPDLDLSHCPDTMLEYLLDVERNMDESIYEYNGHRLNMKDKIGVGIAIDDVPDNALFFNECERDYWAKKPTMPVYKMPSKIHMLPAPVDTTFALYDYNRIKFYGLGGCRTIDITLRHIPYYFTPDNFYDDLPAIKEFRNYLRTATLSSTAKATLINNSIQL